MNTSQELKLNLKPKVAYETAFRILIFTSFDRDLGEQEANSKKQEADITFKDDLASPHQFIFKS